MRRKRFFPPETNDLEESTVNLTPLIDVVFIVLIAFILIAPMLEIDLVDLADGSEDAKKSFDQNTKIQIIVKENNTVIINNERVAINNVEGLLRSYKQKYPQEILQLFHDRKASFGTYQTIKNAAENSGFEEMQVILKPS